MSAPTEYFDFPPDTVELVAGLFPALPHPDGTTLVFPQHADTFPGDTEEEQAAKAGMNRSIAVAFLNGLQSKQHSIKSDAELAQPPQFGEHTIVTLHCATCAGVMLTTTMSRDGKISLPARAINPDCESRHGAVQ